MESSYLELSKEHYMVIESATILWQIPSLKIEMFNYFTNVYNSSNPSNDLVAKKESWTRDIMSRVDRANYQSNIENNNNNNDDNDDGKLKDYMSVIIKSIGDRFIDWIKSILTRLSCKKIQNTYPSFGDYFDNIHWTIYGTIDEEKIFKKLLSSKSMENDSIDMNFMYKEACNLCLENEIEKIWSNFTDEIRENIITQIQSKFIKPDNKIIDLLNYWDLYRCCEKINIPIKNDYNIYFKIISIDICAFGNNISKVKYLYNKLSQNEKDRIVLLAARKLQDNIEANTKMKYENSKCIDSLIYLYNNMSDNIKFEFLKYNYEFVQILIQTWPWKLLILEILDKQKPTLDENSIEKLYEGIYQVVMNEYETFGTIKRTSCWMISECWKIVSSEVKNVKKLFQWNSDELIQIQALCIFISVIDDNLRYKILDIIQPNENQIEDDFFMKFKKCSLKLLIHEKYDILDIFLNKILKNNEDRLFYKRELDVTSAFQYFYSCSRDDSVEKLLFWYFDTEKEIQNFLTKQMN